MGIVQQAACWPLLAQMLVKLVRLVGVEEAITYVLLA